LTFKGILKTRWFHRRVFFDVMGGDLTLGNFAAQTYSVREIKRLEIVFPQ